MNHKQQLVRVIQLGLLILVALMPFHAFLSVWLGSLTHHQAVIQAWKEVLLLLLTGMTLYLLWQDKAMRNRLRNWPVKLAGLFAAAALLVTLITRPSLTAVAFGLKTDLEFVLAFVIALLVATPVFMRRLGLAVLIPAAIVSVFALMQATILPHDFLTHFGYGPNTIVPFEVLDSAVGTLRFASTLGGPNQLGTYLIHPMALALIVALRRRRYWYLLLTASSLLAIFNTYSRAAWLGALAALVVSTLVLVPRRLRAWLLAGFAALGLVATTIIACLLSHGSRLQYYILHGNRLWSSGTGSDYQHLSSLREGLSATLARPFGHGLGTSGPSVFHTGSGLLIEDNYLQYSYEAGWLGLAAFLAFAAATGWQLARLAPRIDLAAASLAAIAGVSITALFLPAWTDSSTALIVWTTAGAALAAKEHHHV